MCEICESDLDAADDDVAPVTFQPDDRSRAWRRRAAEEPGFVGHPPDTGWFCARHVDAARTAARTLTLAEAVRRLSDADAPPTDVTTDPEPDAVDSHPAGGRLVSSDRFGLEWIEWTLPPTDAHVLAASLRSLLPNLFEALGLGPAPTLERRIDRQWTPMDGAQPPWCPFTDTTVDEGRAADGSSVVVEVVLDHWNEDEVAHASVSARIGDRVMISAIGKLATGRPVDTLHLRRPTTAQVVALVATLLP